MEGEIFKFSSKSYNSIYKKTKRQLELKAKKNSKSSTVTKVVAEKIETEAQLKAIKDTMIAGRLLYPNNITLLWKGIYKAHLYRKSGISDPEIVANAISAEQSWRSSSGHAFEYMAKELANLVLSKTQIQFVLQKDLNILIKANEIANEVRDISWLKEQVKTDNFDLYAVATIEDKNYCFGCIQCKTSIRDRVSRDRELSATAMSAFFWSISLVIDGTQLTTPKYVNMVNGGTTTFKKNGWHGMYDLSATKPDGRIYALDVDFDIIKNHALQAFEAWRTQRQWFTYDWTAK